MLSAYHIYSAFEDVLVTFSGMFSILVIAFSEGIMPMTHYLMLPGARHLHWLHVKLAGHSSSGVGELGSQSHPGSVDM